MKLALGLKNSVVEQEELMNETLKLTEKIAKQVPLAVAYAKQQQIIED